MKVNFKIKKRNCSWDSAKCVPLQIAKYAIIGALIYWGYIALYYLFLPISTLD